MAVFIDTYDSLNQINLTDKNEKLEFKNQTFTTDQGLNLKSYKLFSNTIDSLEKNYTYNNLSEDKNIADFATFEKPPFIQDLNTKLGFYATSPQLSSSRYIKVISNFRDDPSQIILDGAAPGTPDQNLLVDFLDEEFCEITYADGRLIKHLYVNEGSVDGDYLNFTFLKSDTRPLSNHIFKYAYDSINKYLTLFKEVSGEQTVVIPSTVYFNSLSASFLTLSAAPINTENLAAGIMSVNSKIALVNSDFLDQYIYYDFENGNKLSTDSVSGIKYDFISYLTFEDLYLSGGNICGYADYFNLKNHISNDNEIHAPSKLENSIQNRKYNSILNNSNIEKENENLTFNYNFYSKEYKLITDKITKFTLPGDIFPYSKLNVNDSTISKNGAFAGLSPYFSDKIFKLQDVNGNNIQTSFTEEEEFIINQDDLSFVLLQDGGLIGLQNYGQIQDNDITGTYLCTWLKGDGVSEGKWLDRYYLPSENSYTAAFSGNKNQTFISLSQAKEYFNQNGITDSFYDIESNMTFEPNATYLYQRVGEKQIKTVVDSQSGNLVKDTLTIQLSNQYLFNQNTLNLNSQNGFDQTPFEMFNSKNFNVSFELELDNLSSLNAYQLFGNLYEDGISLKNNFYFTPYIYLAQDNHLFVYDKDLNLIQKNTYNVQKIIDTLYLEQHNDIVLVCNDRLIKTNIYGEISDEVVNGEGSGREIRELIRSYKDKTYIGYNNVTILADDIDLPGTVNLDLNNLISIKQINNLSAFNSTVYNLTGLVGLVGSKGKLMTTDLAVSLDDEERFIVIENEPGVAANPIPALTFAGTPLSGVYPDGISSRRTFDEPQYNEIVFYAQQGTFPDPNIESKFEKAGTNRIIYDDLTLQNEIEPIIDSIDKKLYDINVFEEKLYVQFVNLQYLYKCISNPGILRSEFQSTSGEEPDLYNKYINGIPENFTIDKEAYNDIISFNISLSSDFEELLQPADGKVQIFDSERYTLSSFNLNSAVVSGYKIDFINDGNEIQLVSFGKDISGSIIVDKFDLTDSKLLGTYNLGISGIDIRKQTYHFCIIDIPSSVTSTIPAISATYKDGIAIDYILNDYEYNSVVTYSNTLSDNFDSESNKRFHVDPIGMHQVYEKYLDYQNKLHFKFNLNSFLPLGLNGVEWQNAGPPAISSFTYNNPAEGLSGWNSFTVPSSEDQTNVELYIKVPPLKINNFFNFNFNLENGVISLYLNGLNYGAIKFNPNYYPINRLLYPNLFLNSPNIKNEAVSKSTNHNDFFSKGGIIKNYRIYNNNLNSDMINYLYMSTLKVDDLNFDIQCGTRNNIEEVNNLYNYKIPGFKNDTTKIIIKNISLSDDTITELIEYLDLNIGNALPFNVQKTVYSINGSEYQVKNNKTIKIKDNINE